MAKGYDRAAVKKSLDGKVKDRLAPKSRVIKRKVKTPRTSKFKIRLEAHRGYHRGGIPENTIPAFKKALEYDVDGIELDVWLTSDKVPIIMHGHDDFGGLECGEFKKNVKDATYQEIRDNIRLGADGTILVPTLDEVLTELKGHVSINIELKGKNPESVPKVLELVNKHDMFDQVFFSSFNHPYRALIDETLAKLNINKKVLFGFLNKNPDFNAFDAMQLQKDDLFTQSYLMIQENREKVTKLVSLAREKGMRIGFYFPLNIAETDAEIQILLDDFKADCVVTNHPESFGEFFGRIPPPAPRKRSLPGADKKMNKGGSRITQKNQKTGKK